MSKILAREEKIVLPDWEEVEEFFANPVNKNKEIEADMFLSKGVCYQLIVTKDEIVIYSRSSKMGAIWQPMDFYMNNKINYIKACEILEKLFCKK